MSLARILRFITLIAFFSFAFHLLINAQTRYTQFSNEVDLVRTINDRWSAELDIANTFSTTPSESNIFKTKSRQMLLAGRTFNFHPAGNFHPF